MNYTENNKLIAEFMGLTPCDTQEQHDTEQDKGNERRIHTSELKYHESWDWLMPVIERIQKEGFKTSIENNWTSIDGCTDETDGIWFETTGANLNMLQATYEAVIKFIKWYNQNKQQ